MFGGRVHDAKKNNQNAGNNRPTEDDRFDRFWGYSQFHKPEAEAGRYLKLLLNETTNYGLIMGMSVAMKGKGVCKRVIPTE